MPHLGPSEPLEHRAFRLAYPGSLHREIGQAAARWGLEPFAFLALLLAESGLEPRVVNKRSGCSGIAQLCPGGRREVERLRRARGAPASCTAAQALEPREALPAAAELLASLRDRCGDLGCALRWYNVGRRGAPNGFARRILRHANRLRTAAGLPPVPRENRHPRPAPDVV
jgi:soluble lytic murein transglycosylase-like protein